jgi:signal transduction histidine kinase
VPLPTRTNKLARKARKNARKVQQEIRQSVADLEARKIEAGLE